MGAWIEIQFYLAVRALHLVAPYMGAWIEILTDAMDLQALISSLPTWERGLKSDTRICNTSPPESLPTWERGLKWISLLYSSDYFSRSLHGSVD